MQEQRPQRAGLIPPSQPLCKFADRLLEQRPISGIRGGAARLGDRRAIDFHGSFYPGSRCLLAVALYQEIDPLYFRPAMLHIHGNNDKRLL
jgi:hypothetical protein